VLRSRGVIPIRSGTVCMHAWTCIGMYLSFLGPKDICLWFTFIHICTHIQLFSCFRIKKENVFYKKKDMLFICHKNENLQSTSSSSSSSNFIHPLLILVPPSLPPPSTTAAASSSCHSTCLASRQTTNHYPELMEIVFFNEIVDGDCWSSSEGWRRRSACNANLYAKSWCGEKFNIFCRGNLLLTDKYYIANLFKKKQHMAVPSQIPVA